MRADAGELTTRGHAVTKPGEASGGDDPASEDAASWISQETVRENQNDGSGFSNRTPEPDNRERPERPER